MKRTFFLLLPLLIVGPACQKEAPDPTHLQTHSLSIHVQSFFENDQVEVEIDGGAFSLESTCTTLPQLGLAHIFEPLELEKGSHHLLVRINGADKKIDLFKMKKNRYLGINFNADDHTVFLWWSDEPFIYD